MLGEEAAVKSSLTDVKQRFTFGCDDQELGTRVWRRSSRLAECPVSRRSWRAASDPALRSWTEL
jgi:hypothetical protein